FFSATATPEIYPLSLHDALPISRPACRAPWSWGRFAEGATVACDEVLEAFDPEGARPLGALRLPAVGLDYVDDRLRLRSEEPPRSEEHTSELQSRGHLVCRLLLE